MIKLGLAAFVVPIAATAAWFAWQLTRQRDTGTPPRTGSNAAQVSVGTHHSCAVLSDGTLACWGGNSTGQLGPARSSHTPIVVAGESPPRVVQVSANLFQTCFRLADGSVWLLGRYETSEPAFSDHSVAARLDSLTQPATQISCAGYGGCAVVADGSLHCWGGSLGWDYVVPTNLAGFEVAQVAVGDDHACALGRDGSLRCWGENTYGQLGNRLRDSGTASSGGSWSASNVEMPAGLTATQIAVGGATSCGVFSDGRIWCWGINSLMGDDVGGAARCWGPNVHCENWYNLVPTLISGLDGLTATRVSVSYAHVCGAFTDGRIRCWGENESARLGDGTDIDRPLPVVVVGVPPDLRAVDVSSNERHNCALFANGEVWCWGDNLLGQLGPFQPSSMYGHPPQRAFP